MNEPRVLGARVVQARPLAGGSINVVEHLVLDDGREVVRKRAAVSEPPPGMFPAEARGLSWLAEAAALRVPEVLDVDEHAIVLEYLAASAPVSDFDERLGRGLAALHRCGAPGYGLEHDNYIATLPQRGFAPVATWPSFYFEHRLAPMAEHAESKVPGSGLRGRIDALGPRLPRLVHDDASPARLHGDLWGGNLHGDEAGAPALIDPAVYGGHREMDLAMMRLFGGFSSRVFAAYEEVMPLAPGAEGRTGLHQLYPLLVHVALFGAGYVGQVDMILRSHGV